MAEVVVNVVVGKLAHIIEKEIHFLVGVGDTVKRVQRELIRIQCCLRDADSKRKRDARVQNWLNELRSVAYRIEDTTDTFFLEVEDSHHQNSRFLHKLTSKPREMHILHKLGTELHKILNELEEISKSREDYGIISLQDMVEEAVILPVRIATYSEVDETDVVGLHADKYNILKLLHSEEIPRRAVITIVGAGGLGKTTLAHMIYKSAGAKFKYHIMLSVSQKFSLTDMLRRMHQLIDSTPKEQDVGARPIDSTPKEKDVGELISELRIYLSSRRYLIILDDVWQVDLWNQLKNILPDKNNGSRVLITSRSIDVAKSADPKMVPYKLNLLDDQKSLDLLLKKAHLNQEPNEEVPSDLLKLAGQLSKKCKGLPLALIVLGGILSTKERNYHAWERVLRTMDWHSEGKECMDVLTMSYEDMPYYIKACFLYLASFPEDYQISARRLIRMWVAEGFISQEERKTMEETAEDYLDQLFQRCMIQVRNRHVNGSIKYFQVHDLLRDLAMHNARQENFVMLFSEESNSKMPNKDIRHASFHSVKHFVDDPHLHNNLTSLERASPNVRSLLMVGSGHLRNNLTPLERASSKIRTLLMVGSGHIQIPNWCKFRLLKVVELEGVLSDDVNLVSGLDELVHLKYLGLRNCYIPISECSFHRMKALETLDVQGIDNDYEVPDGLWSIDTLRHVISNGTLEIPEKIAELKNIQTLQWVQFDGKMPLLSNLCKLGIETFLDDPIEFTNLFATLPSLVSLGIHGWCDRLPMEVVYPKSLPNYQHLQSLYLRGSWLENVTLNANLFPPNLLKLELRLSRIGQNPMRELGKLKSLKKLILDGGVLSEELFNSGPIICPAGFPVLQYLKLGRNSMKGLTVAKGGMPKLTYLAVPEDDFKLQLPPDLQHGSITFTH